MIAIISGATGGLGKSYVLEAVNRGYKVIITATKQERLDALKEEINNKTEGACIFAKACNLADDNSRKEFFEALKQENIVADMLINNAGYILEGSFLGCNNDEIVNATKVNCVGTLDFTYKFLKQIDPNKRAYCLIVSSLAGFYPMPQMAVYGGTKSMLNRFAVALRREVRGKNINVTACCPGSMATNEDMKLSIKSQGLGGKLSLQDTSKVARVSINKVLKNKPKYIPGGFNKCMWGLSKLVPETFIANLLYKRWTKCEKKRNQYR